jgi:galactokinase
LREVTSEKLNDQRDLPDLLRRRAAHIVEENERVWRALDLLVAGDGPGFGALLNASHESSRQNFENSTPELDLLVSIAQQLPGVLGARLTGGGFGGATITLCERSAAEAAAEQLAKRYRAETGIISRVLIAAIADGAR